MARNGAICPCVTAASTAGTEALAGGDNAVNAQNSVLQLATASGESGLDGVAAQGLLDSAGRGVHSSTFQLNLSATCGIGGAFRGCLGVVQGV